MWKQWKQWLTLFLGAPKSLQMVTAAMKLKDAYSLEGKLWPTCGGGGGLVTKSPLSMRFSRQNTGVGCHFLLQRIFPTQGSKPGLLNCRQTLYHLSHQGSLWIWELDHKERWAPKNWCFWTVVLEKTRESPLNCKEIQQVHPKGNESWIFIGRTDTEAETPILYPPEAKSHSFD